MIDMAVGCFLSNFLETFKADCKFQNGLVFESLEKFYITICVVDYNGLIRYVEVISIIFQPLSLKTGISNNFLFVNIYK